MAGGAEDGGAEDLHRMELCISWIYEYFSRHRLDEAREGSLLFLLYALTYSSRCFVCERLFFLNSLTYSILVLFVLVRLVVLVKSAEKRFHVSLSSLQEHSDPCSILQQLLDKGKVGAMRMDSESRLMRRLFHGRNFVHILLRLRMPGSLENMRAAINLFYLHNTDMGTEWVASSLRRHSTILM